MRRAIALILALSPAAALACELPAETEAAPWRRAVAKVKYLPETEAMAELQSRERNVVQYVVLLDGAKRVGGHCYWPVEVRVDGRLWKRFLVTPDGESVREEMREEKQP